MIKYSSYLIVVVCFVSSSLFGQNSTLDGKPLAESHVREADIMWMKRVWRRIDVRQKINHPYFYPVNLAGDSRSLFDHLLRSIETGELTAFNPGPIGIDDWFQVAFTIAGLDSMINRTYQVKTTNPITLQDEWVTVSDRLEYDDILYYEIKEDWFFDKERSVMDVRIVGLCPIIAIYDQTTGDFRGVKRLFWIDMKSARSYMDTWFAFNPSNDREMRSFDELFQKRIFSSYIIKESNVYDRYISEYAVGKEALFESDRIQNEILVMEHDLWSY